MIQLGVYKMSIDDDNYELKDLKIPLVDEMLKYVTVMERQAIQLEHDKRVLVSRLIDCGLATKLEKESRK